MKHGFTLIEVLVTMAIVSILAGMLVPAVWTFWENQEVQTTKERLNTLKLAMVGDRSLVQNGIRTSYGYVGDNGELPIQGRLSTASLKTYIPGGYHVDVYKDAWGRPFRYTAYDNLPGYDNRYLSGEMRSAGLNGIFDDADDIMLSLNASETAPTNFVQGELNISGNPPITFSTNLAITYRDPDGERTIYSKCKGLTFQNISTTLPIVLPIGKIAIKSVLYSDAICGTFKNESDSLNYFISDNMNKVYFSKLPQLTYSPP